MFLITQCWKKKNLKLSKHFSNHYACLELNTLCLNTLSKFPNEELNNQVNKIQPLPKNDSHPQLLKDCYFCKEAIDHVCLKLFKNHKSCINCLNMTIANQKILKCSNCRKNYEIYRQKYEKKRDTSHQS